MKRILPFIALALAIPAVASSQALTSLQSVRVGYNTRKATVKPTGELKAQIDEIDRQIAEATRLGKNAELRRLMAKGTTLLAGRPWTDVLDYTNSVVLRTDHIVADSTKPYPVRLEQIYSPSIELTHALTAHVIVRQRPAPRQGRRTAGARRGRQGPRKLRRRCARPARVAVRVRTRRPRRSRRHLSAEHRGPRRRSLARHEHAPDQPAQGPRRSGGEARGRCEEGAGRSALRHSLPGRSDAEREPREDSSCARSIPTRTLRTLRPWPPPRARARIRLRRKPATSSDTTCSTPPKRSSRITCMCRRRTTAPGRIR